MNSIIKTYNKPVDFYFFSLYYSNMEEEKDNKLEHYNSEIKKKIEELNHIDNIKFTKKKKMILTQIIALTHLKFFYKKYNIDIANLIDDYVNNFSDSLIQSWVNINPHLKILLFLYSSCNIKIPVPFYKGIAIRLKKHYSENNRYFHRYLRLLSMYGLSKYTSLFTTISADFYLLFVKHYKKILHFMSVDNRILNLYSYSNHYCMYDNFIQFVLNRENYNRQFLQNIFNYNNKSLANILALYSYINNKKIIPTNLDEPPYSYYSYLYHNFYFQNQKLQKVINNHCIERDSMYMFYYAKNIYLKRLYGYE